MEHIYVFEISGIDRIKVGMSKNLGKRMADHIGSAERFGVEISRFFAVGCVDAAAAEARLIAALQTDSRTSLAAGREWFSGVPYADAVALAEQAVDPLSALPSPGADPDSGFVAHLDWVTTECVNDFMWTEDVLLKLATVHPDLYGDTTQKVLGRRLRGLGIEIRQLDRAGPDGARRNRRGILIADVDRAVGRSLRRAS